MDMLPFFRSILEEDRSAVVICDTEHQIVYMNPAACERYRKHGGAALVGRNLLHCHNAKSNEMILKVLDWFKTDCANQRVHTYYNKKEQKDVYMVALRNEQGALIGYYERHEYRSRDLEPFYKGLDSQGDKQEES